MLSESAAMAMTQRPIQSWLSSRQSSQRFDIVQPFNGRVARRIVAN
jgi:hypothetical protein